MTYPTGATPPNYPATPQYPQYPQYPGYPSYPAYPQYAPAPQWTPQVQLPPPPLLPLPAEQTPHGLAPDRYARVGAIVAICVVVVAVVLASIAPFLANHSSGVVPSNWAKIYDGQPNAAGAYWQIADGCAATSQGLHVSTDPSSDTASECRFVPSETQDLTSQGFYFEAVTAAPAEVDSEEDPVMAFGVSGNTLAFIFGQEGDVTACSGACSPNSGDGIYSIGIAGSWHTNGYTANTIALLYSAQSQQVTLYANGQEAMTVAFTAPPSSHLILSVATSSTGPTEALYTHVRVFSGSVSE